MTGTSNILCSHTIIRSFGPIPSPKARNFLEAPEDHHLTTGVEDLEGSQIKCIFRSHPTSTVDCASNLYLILILYILIVNFVY